MADMIALEKEYQIDPFEAFDENSIVNKFRDFRDRSKKKFGDNYEKMRVDRDFLIGETQWTKADGRHVSDKRNRMILNIISNSVNAVVNQYSVYPFAWYTGKPEEDQLLDKLMKRGSNAVCTEELGWSRPRRDGDGYGRRRPPLHLRNQRLRQGYT